MTNVRRSLGVGLAVAGIAGCTLFASPEEHTSPRAEGDAGTNIAPAVDSGTPISDAGDAEGALVVQEHRSYGAAQTLGTDAPGVTGIALDGNAAFVANPTTKTIGRLTRSAFGKG